jgi:outer membrane protein assembly factor BamE (lipoprotein component of BamABCDE complex)
MTRFGRIVLLGASMALAAASGACAPTRDTRGYVLNERAVEGITPGRDTRDTVLVALGSPSAVGTFEQNRWYYVGAQTLTAPYRRAQVLDQQVVAIAFSEAGVVSDVQRFTLADAMAIDPVERETATRGRELGVIEQFVGNIGRFNTAQPARGVGGGN